MDKRGRTALIAAAVAVVVAAGGAVVWTRHRSNEQAKDRQARAAAEKLIAAWPTGAFQTVPWQGGTTGAAMAAEYKTLVAGMGSAKPALHLAGPVKRTGSSATATVTVTWPLGPGATWRYSLPVALAEQDATWRIGPEGVAGSSLFAPVTRDAHLSLTRDQGTRADLLGKGGTPIVSPGHVVDVGIEPARVTDLGSLVTQVAQLTGVSAGPLRKAVKAAQPHAFVPVITLRQSDYDKVESQLRPLPGTVFRSRTQALALTRDFARALIGTVGPVTGDIVKASQGRYGAGDFAGVSGLQRQYDAQLAGTASYTVSEVSKDSSGDAQSTALFHVDGAPGKPVRTTLDPKVQKAADAALRPLTVPGSLVAIDVKSGHVLAVANNPSNGLDAAVVGQYPPGSTLKVATTLALLKDGLGPNDTVNCPASISVGGRSFRNFEHESGGPLPFRTDFAMSCNTAFVNASKRLGRSDLHTAAGQLGLGLDWGAALGAGPQTFTGSIPANTSAVDQAAASFGQGRNLVSPLSMAVMAASVARGHFVAPALVTSPAPTATVVTASAPTAKQIATLHTLMRSVVVSGTAAGKLDGVPGGAIFAKTGTAEFGSANPPETHGWLVGWQGNIAFAAFVEKGTSGATAAGPVVRRFLTGVRGG